MEKFEIKPTAHTPYIKVDYDRGEIVYKGRFIPDIDPFDFLRPVIQAIDVYSKSPLMHTTLEVYYEYVNTGNLHAFITFFQQIKKLENQGVELICKWHFEDETDEDSIDLCEHISENSGLKFIMIDDSKAKLD